MLIFETDKNNAVVTTYPRGTMTDCDLAKKMVMHECEAVLCGPIEEDPFVIIADEGCITRYKADGMRANQALVAMLHYRLGMIPDFIGGTGCHSGDEANCADHDHGDE